MHIAHLSCVYPPYGGGIGVAAYHIARLAAAEHEVRVVVPRVGSRQRLAASPGVHLRPLPTWVRLGNAAVLRGLRRELAWADLVHLHYPFFGVQELLPWLPTRTRLVLSFHMVAAASGFKGSVFRAEAALFDRRLARRADLMTAATRDYLATYGVPRFGDSPKWRLLPYGAAETYQSGEPPVGLHAQLGLKPAVPVVLFVGTLDAAHAFKGLPVLLQALARLAARPWHLVVVGGGSDRATYEGQAAGLGLGRRVTFTGYVPEPDLPGYYQLATLFAFPSTSEAEAFGFVALQALASGIPVVASQLPGVREVVRQGETGLLVPPGDPLALGAAIETLLADPAAARAMGERAAVGVERSFRWPMVGRKLLGLYRELT